MKKLSIYDENQRVTTNYNTTLNTEDQKLQDDLTRLVNRHNDKRDKELLLKFAETKERLKEANVYIYQKQTEDGVWRTKVYWKAWGFTGVFSQGWKEIKMLTEITLEKSDFYQQAIDREREFIEFVRELNYQNYLGGM